MPLELGVWRIDEGRPNKVEFGPLDLERRLQDILEHDIAIASPSWFVIGKEVPTSFGKRIDLLAMNANGDVIVVELKKGRTEREVIAQLLDYGSWVNDLRADRIAEIYSAYCLKCGDRQDRDFEAAFKTRFSLRTMPEEINSAHELVVVGTEFDASTERIADYLSGRGVRINAIFFNVFRDGDREYLTRAWLNGPERS